MSNTMKRFSPLAAGLIGMLAATASADVSNVVFSVTATNSQGTATWQGTVVDGYFDDVAGTYDWAMSGPLDLVDPTNGNVIATLTEGSTHLVMDPQINLTFAVQAGNTDTSFTISSALLSFSTINSAVGKSSAAMSVTDLSGDGATLTGDSANGLAYLTQYNGFVPGGTTFSEDINTISAGAFLSGNASSNVPPIGTSPIGGSVSNMSAQIKFVLSANDIASGTTNFEITPEPATLALLGAGFGLIRRRR